MSHSVRLFSREPRRRSFGRIGTISIGMMMPAVAALLLLAVSGCIEQSTTPVVFDQNLESTTFENKLLAPIVIFRNGVVLDTLPARGARSYQLRQKGVFSHAWQLVAPVDQSGRPGGLQLRDSLGIQYRVNARYIITNETPSQGTIFTPRILNATFYDLRLTANWLEQDQFSTNYVIGHNRNTPLDTAPYYFWHDNSNIYLSATSGGYTFRFSRNDTTYYGDPVLRLDPSSEYDGSGATYPITVTR